MKNVIESNFTTVTQKISGTIRENSLYHFVRENPGCLTDFVLEEANTESRHVLYLTPNPGACEQPLFRGIEPMESHLSIDKLFSRENARHADGFGPAHWTVSYEELRLHVYFNVRGDILDIHIKSDLDSSYLAFSETEQRQIVEQTKSVQAMLQGIISHKQKAYLDLQSALIDKETELSCASNLDVYLEKGHAYLDIIGKINRYCDTERMQQGIHVQRIMAQKQAEHQAKAALSKEKNTRDAVPQEMSDEISIVEKSTTETAGISTAPKLEHLKNELKAVVEEVKTCHERGENSPVHLIPLLYQVEYISLDITFLAQNKVEKQASQKYIKKQKAKLPVTLQSFSQEFERKLYDGDVEYIRENYAQIAEITKLAPVFFAFIYKLSDESSNPDLESRRLAVAEYLYEHSELYRSALDLQSRILQANVEQVGYGLLIDCFIKNKLKAFKMFLRQGVSPETDQFMCNAQFLNALQGVTFLFSKNTDISFVEALLEHNAPLTQVRFKRITHMAFMHDICAKSSAKKLKKFEAMHPQGESEILKQLFKDVVEDNHALKTAARLYVLQFPALFKLLASQTEPVVLYEILGNLLNDSAVITRSAIDPSGETDLHFLFFKNNDSTKTEEEKLNLFESIRYVIAAAQAKVSELELNEQRKLIKVLTQKAEEVGRGDWEKAFTLLKAALLAYTSQSDKTNGDDTNAYRIYMRIAQIIKPYHPRAAEVEEMRARQFLTGICAKRRRAAADEKIKLPEISIFDAFHGEPIDASKTSMDRGPSNDEKCSENKYS